MREPRLLNALAGILLTAVATLALRVPAAYAGAEDWNDKQIAWKSYDDGLAEAKQTKRPVCLIFYTAWCPHCANYSKVFSDPKVVEKSKSFVMIRLDADKNRDLGKKYSPDGGYIPRTFFLTSGGELDASLDAGRPTYKYFYDENNPAGVLAGMDRALQKIVAK
jgi:protein-disulfide reductase (glutathione)